MTVEDPNQSRALLAIKEIADPRATADCKARLARLAVIHQLAWKALSGIRVEDVPPEFVRVEAMPWPL